MEQPLDDIITTPRSAWPQASATASGDVSLGELFSDLTTDLSTLVRKEIELAKTETIEKVSSAGRNVGMIVAGGLLAYAGLICVLIAIAIGLGNWIGYGLASLIVGVLVIILGFVLVQSGLAALKHMSVTPEKTIETLKDNTEWVKEKVQ